MKKTIMAVILTVSMFILTCVPVYADTQSIDVTADATQSATPTFQVSLSDSVSLANVGTDSSNSSNNKWTGSYTVKVTTASSSWSNDKYVLAKPKSSTFDLVGTSNQNSKYTATVSQPKLKWATSEAISYNGNNQSSSDTSSFNTAVTGTISTSIPKTANDVYTGSLIIEYSAQDD